MFKNTERTPNFWTKLFPFLFARRGILWLCARRKARMPTGVVPRQSFPKTAKVAIGGAYWTKSEPILSKIQRILRIESLPAGRQAAQRFRPPPLRYGEQNRKIFFTFFYSPAPKFFSIKETKIFLFCLPLARGIAETLPPHCPPSAFAEVLADRSADWQAGPIAIFRFAQDATG